MLPDFRFVLGAILALTMLAVGGLGLVTSVQLVREAHMAPLEESRSLAFAGHTEWNQFYDPDTARRFEGLAGMTEAPVAEARLEPPAEALAPPAPAAPEAVTAAIPVQQPEAVVAQDVGPPSADDKAPEKSPEPTSPLAVAAPPTETTPPEGERIASLTVPSPGSDPRDEADAPAQPQAAGAEPPDSLPPTPRARPKLGVHRRLARARIRAVPSLTQQPSEISGFPPSPWPGYDNQFTGTTMKTNAGKLTGR
jgi:hypothetical protein